MLRVAPRTKLAATNRLTVVGEARRCQSQAAAAAGLRKGASSMYEMSAEVSQAALGNSGRDLPRIVALESTIITHGMPFPQNLEAARRVEETVRSNGAVPATIAVIDGKVKVGLSDGELEQVASSVNDTTKKPLKAGRRDLAYACGLGKIIAGTTVSATAAICQAMDLRHFATGGIGGVHRGAESTMDVSADLVQLGQTDINIFCSGAKSILDIPRTLEYLETQNVGVYSLNPTGEFPAFYTSKSGYFVPSVAAVKDIARIVDAKYRFQFRGSTVWAVPIPEQYESQGDAIQAAVEQAVQEAKEQGVDKRGKEVTPWLLARVNELTKGTSLKSNIELVVNNARVAAQVAKEWAQMAERAHSDTLSLYPPQTTTRSLQNSDSQDNRQGLPRSAPLLVVGCAAIDVVTEREHAAPKSTSRGTVSITAGGVANNIAQAANNVLQGYARLATSDRSASQQEVQLIAPVLDDLPGQMLRKAIEKQGLDSQGLFTAAAEICSTSNTPTKSTTPMVVLNLDSEHDLIDGVASTSLVETAFTAERLQRELSRCHAGTSGARLVVFDGNLTSAAMSELITWKLGSTQSNSHHLIFETTSTAKCTRVIEAIAGAAGQHPGSHVPVLDIITPNLVELETLVKVALKTGLVQNDSLLGGLPAGDDLSTQIKRASLLCQALSPWIQTFLVTLGPAGVLSAHREGHRGPLITKHHSRPAAEMPAAIVSTTGAGDSFAGAVAAYAATQARQNLNHAILDDERSVEEAVRVGQLASACSLEVWEPVERHNMSKRCGELMRDFSVR